MASRFKGGSRKKESDYYDEEAIEDVDDAICEIKPLKEIKRLASRIRNRDRTEFSSTYWPPVHLAASFNDAAAIEMLIRELGFRADAIWTDAGNTTPAHEAVYEKSIDAFKTLLEFKPDLSMTAKVESYSGSVYDWISQMEDDAAKKKFLKAVREGSTRQAKGRK